MTQFGMALGEVESFVRAVLYDAKVSNKRGRKKKGRGWVSPSIKILDG